jgi:hypothetical protein
MMIIHTHFKKPKQKKKPGWQKAQAEYDAWLRSVGVNPNQKKVKREFIPYVPEPAKPNYRETKHIPSLSEKDAVSKLQSIRGQSQTPKQEPKVYTGTRLIGIGMLHKSNLVPIFSKEEAEDQAKMRR